jgi:hypothetical protein
MDKARMEQSPAPFLSPTWDDSAVLTYFWVEGEEGKEICSLFTVDLDL